MQDLIKESGFGSIQVTRVLSTPVVLTAHIALCFGQDDQIKAFDTMRLVASRLLPNACLFGGQRRVD